jgi:hypothetical protein
MKDVVVVVVVVVVSHYSCRKMKFFQRKKSHVEESCSK